MESSHGTLPPIVYVGSINVVQTTGLRAAES
jgi:hypothetical protein